MRNLRSCLLALIAVLGLAMFAPATSASEDKLAQLVAKYPLGNIFLTYIPLNDLWVLLGDTRRVDELKKQHPETTLRLLKKFLDDNHQVHMQHSTAFLAINTNTWQAGFKKLSDRSGDITLIVGWDKMQTQQIALFCDAYIMGLARVTEVLHALAMESTRPIKMISERWLEAKQLEADPYVPATQVRDVLHGMRTLLIGLSDEDKSKLKSSDEKTFQEVTKFKQGYESALMEAPRGIPGLDPEKPDFRIRWKFATQDMEPLEFAPLTTLRWRESNAALDAFQDAVGKKHTSLPKGAEQGELRLFLEMGKKQLKSG